MSDAEIQTAALAPGTIFISHLSLSLWVVTVLTKCPDCPEGLCSGILLKFQVAAAAQAGAKLTWAVKTAGKCHLR